MYRTYHRHPHRSSHGLHHLRRMPATAIRYPRSRLSPRHMMMRRPIFYPPPPTPPPGTTRIPPRFMLIQNNAASIE
ncbi:unnamed protein product, partial [Rotaria sp. Silwood2]